MQSARIAARDETQHLKDMIVVLREQLEERQRIGNKNGR
jgi:hypothetical protein